MPLLPVLVASCYYSLLVAPLATTHGQDRNIAQSQSVQQWQSKRSGLHCQPTTPPGRSHIFWIFCGVLCLHGPQLILDATAITPMLWISPGDDAAIRQHCSKGTCKPSGHRTTPSHRHPKSPEHRTSDGPEPKTRSCRSSPASRTVYRLHILELISDAAAVPPKGSTAPSDHSSIRQDSCKGQVTGKNLLHISQLILKQDHSSDSAWISNTINKNERISMLSQCYLMLMDCSNPGSLGLSPQHTPPKNEPKPPTALPRSAPPSWTARQSPPKRGSPQVTTPPEARSAAKARCEEVKCCTSRPTRAANPPRDVVRNVVFGTR